jgi:heavy metal sensor kinase
MGMVAVSLVGWVALRHVLDREIDSSLLNVASIQASSVTESPDGVMRFHEWELTPEEAISVRDLNRYAQVWGRDGRSLLRTRYITRDLPLDTVALERAGAGEISWVRQAFDGIPIRSLYYPLERRGAMHEGHVLQVSAPLEVRDATLRATALYLAAIAILVVGGTWVGAWWLGASAVRPVHQITEQAREIEGGTLDRRIDASAEAAEYRGLVDVLNTMLDRLQRSFATQKQFTQDASHELRGPLTAMRGELEVALRRPRSEDEYQEVLESSLEEVERLGRMSDDLLALTRIDGSGSEPAERVSHVSEVVERVVDRFAQAAEVSRITLTFHDGGPIQAAMDPDLLARIVWNLLDNAVDHTPVGGAIRIVSEVRGFNVRLEVHDSGPGVAPEHREKVFDRFFRGDEAREPRRDGRAGTGLGLSIVQSGLAAHDGRAWVDDSDLGGAAFILEFPAARV